MKIYLKFIGLFFTLDFLLSVFLILVDLEVVSAAKYFDDPSYKVFGDLSLFWETLHFPFSSIIRFFLWPKTIDLHAWNPSGFIWIVYHLGAFLLFWLTVYFLFLAAHFFGRWFRSRSAAH